MTTASKEAFADLKDSGKLSKQERLIIRYLVNYDSNIARLSAATTLRESTVTARISGLREKGYVKEAGKSGKYTLWQYVSDPDERKQVAHEYRRKRFIATAERMLNEYGEFIHMHTVVKLTDDFLKAKRESNT